MSTTKKPIQKIIKSGFNKTEKQFWTMFQYDDREYFIIWQTKSDNQDDIAFDVGIWPSALLEGKDGFGSRTTGKKTKDETSLNKNAKSRA